MKVVITKEDVDKHLYTDPCNCPMASKLKEMLGLSKVTFFWNVLKDMDEYKTVGHIKPDFTSKDYYKLKNGEIKEFVTEYTPINI